MSHPEGGRRGQMNLSFPSVISLNISGRSEEEKKEALDRAILGHPRSELFVLKFGSMALAPLPAASLVLLGEKKKESLEVLVKYVDFLEAAESQSLRP